MMQYDVIENNGVLASSRREAIIDNIVDVNHNDNKPAHGKKVLREQDADQTCGLISTLAACIMIRCVKQRISAKS